MDALLLLNLSNIVCFKHTQTHTDTRLGQELNQILDRCFSFSIQSRIRVVVHHNLIIDLVLPD